MANGGVSGNTVGTIQLYATAHPTDTPFKINVPIPTDDTKTSWGSGWTNARKPEIKVEGVDFTKEGGDKESRPINIYVDYYLLSQADPNDADIFPIGAIIGFPGNEWPSEQHWLECGGQSLLRSDPRFEPLYEAIRHDNGGESEGTYFNIPNYRGYFLRGTDRGKHTDPDAADRLPPDRRPPPKALPGGNAGDKVGSFQSFATALPKDKTIVGTVTSPSHTVDLWGGGQALAAWGPHAPIEVVGGGDKETCPINVSIFFFIKYANA
jgi:hypothetical protein